MRSVIQALLAVSLLTVAACSDDGGEERSSPPPSDATTTTEPGTDPLEGGIWDENCQSRLLQTPPECERTTPGPLPDPEPEPEPLPEPEPVPEPELGSGDVQITLRWDSDADLDLHVFEPDGTEISFLDRGPTASGGRLDVDSNVGCSPTGSVENVFWPEGEMPSGDFTVEVDGFEVDGCGSGDYSVTVLVEDEEILAESGSVGHKQSESYDFSV